MARKKTIFSFRQAVEKQFGWNALIGFWFGYHYKMYESGRLTFDDAVAAVGKLKNYQGV